MLLSHTGTRFVLDIPYQDRTLALYNGFIWDGKVWWTATGAIANHFSNWADQSAYNYLQDFNQRVADSRAKDSIYDYPCPKGLAYLNYQKGGISYSLERADTYIGDGMRLGKTPESIGVINADRSIESGLVITKASLKINWERELEKWLVRDMSVSICPSGSEAITNTDIVITNYENVPKQKSSIMKRKWGVVIFDESHKLANAKAQRTIYCLGKTYRKKLVESPILADRRMFLSGTPITKRPVNLWPICHAVDPGGLGKDWYYYTHRYCGAWNAPWGEDVSGKSHLNEFQNRLRSTFMIRRVREEVLTELPEIRRMIIPLIPEGIKKLLEQERTLFGNKAEVMKIAREKAMNAQKQGDELAYTKAVDELEKLNDIAMSMMATLRHETAVAKIPYIIDTVDDVLEEEQKVVVFAHHRDVIAEVTAQLCKKLKSKVGAVCHYGDISAKEKQKAIDTFNTNPKCHVFVAAISGAEGYDIAVSSYGLFAEYDWTAGTMQQAEDRLFAIGKVDSILYQYLVWDGSLDANMAKDYVEASYTIFKAIG